MFHSDSACLRVIWRFNPFVDGTVFSKLKSFFFFFFRLVSTTLEFPSSLGAQARIPFVFLRASPWRESPSTKLNCSPFFWRHFCMVRVHRSSQSDNGDPNAITRHLLHSLLEYALGTLEGSNPPFFDCCIAFHASLVNISMPSHC